MCFSRAGRSRKPSDAARSAVCEPAHMLQRLQVAAGEKACEYGAILQPDTER
jgi:hypothetical protein